MLPRDIVLAAVNKKEIFPVPVDVSENGIYPLIESKLCNYYGLKQNDHEGILKVLGADLRWANAVYKGPDLKEGNFQIKPFSESHVQNPDELELRELRTDLIEGTSSLRRFPHVVLMRAKGNPNVFVQVRKVDFKG